jgi:ATP-binding cassette subfamily B protein
LSLAGLTILVVAVAGLYLPVKSWLDQKRYLRRGRAAAAEVFEFLDRHGDQGQMSDAEFLHPMSRSLEFTTVGLREPAKSQPLLHNVNLRIAAGEKIALMGADDNEKLALLYLIPRFFDPTEGEIRIDGRDLRWVTHESLRSQIGLVVQSNLVFNDTVANNIGCGDPGMTLPRIIEAAKIAHAHQFIVKLPYGYETTIGEIGYSLSPGEQFRIALARAILRDPAIYIIEEPRIAIDDDTRALLDDTFSRILPDKTVIFLPHRISTMRLCDRIVVMNNGGIEAVGNHHDLVHSSSLYKHLYYLEFNAFAEQAAT